ncbi:hypothetical protein ISCGN_010144 [Ixodes scapularis]
MLRFYSAGTFQVVTGDLVNVSQPTVCCTVGVVMQLIVRHLFRDFVHFPSAAQFGTVMRDFYALAHSPKVSGRIDCTPVRIKSTGGNDTEVFRNRKGVFSIYVQKNGSPDLDCTPLFPRCSNQRDGSPSQRNLDRPLKSFFTPLHDYNDDLTPDIIQEKNEEDVTELPLRLQIDLRLQIGLELEFSLVSQGVIVSPAVKEENDRIQAARVAFSQINHDWGRLNQDFPSCSQEVYEASKKPYLTYITKQLQAASIKASQKLRKEHFLARHRNNSLSTEREGRHELIPDTGESNEETFQCSRSAWDYALDHPEHMTEESTDMEVARAMTEVPEEELELSEEQKKHAEAVRLKTAGVLDSMPIGMKSRYRRVKYSANP